MFSPEQVIKVAEKLETLTEEQAGDTIEKAYNEQPYIFAYADAVCGEIENEDDADYLLTLVILIFMIYSEYKTELKQVDDKTIHSEEEKHYATLREIQGKEGEEFKEAALALVAKRPEAALSDFVDREVTEGLDETTRGVGLALMNVVIESFNTVSSK